jgi:hypothetical protein
MSSNSKSRRWIRNYAGIEISKALASSGLARTGRRREPWQGSNLDGGIRW